MAKTSSNQIPQNAESYPAPRKNHHRICLRPIGHDRGNKDSHKRKYQQTPCPHNAFLTYRNHINRLPKKKLAQRRKGAEKKTTLLPFAPPRLCASLIILPDY